MVLKYARTAEMHEAKALGPCRAHLLQHAVEAGRHRVFQAGG